MSLLETLALRYRRAAERMQSGVAMMMNFDPSVTAPKHLRVGVNVALRDHYSLVELLIRKGVITTEEYHEAMASGMEIEANEHERRVQDATGNPNIKLGGTIDTIARGDA